MWFVLALVAVVVALVVWAAVIDFRARRRGVRHSPDQGAVRDHLRATGTDLNLRNQGGGY